MIMTNKDITVYGYAGSFIETYASENNIKFIAIQ